MLIRSGALDVVVIDSVAALTPRAEIEGEMGDTHVGLQARLMSQALRKLTANLNRTKTIAIFINQLREKIGVMFGSPETTPGGRALKFYSSCVSTSADREHQGRRRDHRLAHAGQGREEQGGAAVQAGGVRHHVRQGHQP
jgi:protein RecA